MLLSINICAGDFDELFDTFSDEGIGAAIAMKLKMGLERSLATQLGDDLIGLKIEQRVVVDVTLQAIYQAGGFGPDLSKITVDFKKAARPPVTGLELTSGVLEGYLDVWGNFNRRPSRIRMSEMATRDRCEILRPALVLTPPALGISRDMINSCRCPIDWLRPILRKPTRGMQWHCACCGRKYLCTCASGVQEYYASRPNYDTSEARRALAESTYRDGICHICRGLRSRHIYRSPMYGGSAILNAYAPYVDEAEILYGVDRREAENRVRDRLGVPRIGEGWLGETQLYNTVCALFPEHEVQREASPDWLGRLRFDIFLPEVGVAVEYHGYQHFFPVDVFGGEAGLRRTQERDKEKLTRAAAAGVRVVEIRFDEDLDEKQVRERIERAMRVA